MRNVQASRLQFTEYGLNGQPAVLFLHGFMGSSRDWEAIHETIHPRCHVVCPDLPGHGNSVNLSPALYQVEGLMDALRSLLDALGIERCTLVGYSMGGRMALAFAVRHPDRCAQLVIESASPGLADPTDRAERRSRDESVVANLLQTPMHEFLESWYSQPLFATLRNHVHLYAETVQRRLRNRPNELARALRGLGSGIQPPLWERLSELRVFTHVVVGAHDEKYVALAGRMARRIPRSEVHVVPGVGHNVHLENPGRYRRILHACITKRESECRM